MSSRSAPFSLHHASIVLVVFLEYLQTIMVSFASSYISGGIDAAPEEFSLAAACYATVAVVMILAHRWLVQQLGYRRMLRLSLLTFGLGALVCALSDSVPVFVLGRMIQASGGAAFFTASRVQALHYQGKNRVPALLCLPAGIVLASAIAPVLAAFLVNTFSWRALFWVMLPLTLWVDQLVACAVPDHEPVENEQPDQLHPWGILALTLGVFVLQFVLERSRFDLFDHSVPLYLGGVAACVLLVTYLWHDWHRTTPLISYAQFSSYRYWFGLCIYGFGYLVISSSNYILPVFMVQGLGFAVQTTGWMLGLSSLIGLLTVPLHFRLMMRWPFMRPYLMISMVMLALFGWLGSRFSQEVPLSAIGAVLLVLNGLFMPFALGTAAAGTFRGINEKVFTHAYQVKNSMREVANATGVSIATVLLQMRESLHSSRLAETTASIQPGYGASGSGPDPWSLLDHPGTAALARLASEISRQSVLMACQDYFWGLCALALCAMLLVGVGRRLV
jgi:MFS family permease